MVAGSVGWIRREINQFARPSCALARVTLASTPRCIFGEMALGVFGVAGCNMENTKTSTLDVMVGLGVLPVPIVIATTSTTNIIICRHVDNKEAIRLQFTAKQQ